MAVSFGKEFVEKTMERVASVPEDAKPLWGDMTPGRMRAHLHRVLQTSQDANRAIPEIGNLFARAVLRPLFFSGLMKFPKNVKAPANAVPDADVSIEELGEELQKFLAAYQDGSLQTPKHPYFGELGPGGWGKFHVVHFDHHLRQFGA